ncbi:MAG: hypothetical protein QME49_02420 [bacterium]|nr:hypothetical protein [bacterium]
MCYNTMLPAIDLLLAADLLPLAGRSYNSKSTSVSHFFITTITS